MTDAGPQKGASPATAGQSFGIGLGGNITAASVVAWLAVGLPILWGLFKALQGAAKIFG